MFHYICSVVSQFQQMLNNWVNFRFPIMKKIWDLQPLTIFVPIGEIVWKRKIKHVFTSKYQNHRLRLKYHLDTDFPLWCFHEFWNRIYSSCRHNMQTCLCDLWLQKLPKPSWSLAILDFLHLQWLRVIWKKSKNKQDWKSIQNWEEFTLGDI